MPPLVELFSFNEPPVFYLFSTPGSTIVKYELALDTRKGYATAIDSYKSFCIVLDKITWPVSTTILEKWVANQIHGSTLPKQGQINPDKVSSYFSALKS